MFTRPKASGKTALVLAGGGVTGAVYEIGALRVIDDLLVDRTVNDFDIYVGTSAGALVCSLLSNGVSPQEVLESFRGANPEIRSLAGADLFTIDRRSALNWGSTIPRRVFEITRNYLRHPEDLNLFELLWSLGEVVPPGLYDGRSLAGYMQGILTTGGRSDRFTDLKRELYLVATDLNTGERTCFSRDEHSDTPISLAVAASTALPPVYRPVAIGEGVYIDGGMRGTASLDIAIEHGADLIVCINPLVPYDNSKWDEKPFFSPDNGYLYVKGLQALLSQVSRISTHAGLHYQIKQIRRNHPEVDIILIEPQPDDCQMFYYNIMRYSVLLRLAEHGFESVTVQMAEGYSSHKATLARHDIPLSRRLVIDELRVIQESGYNAEVLRQVLEKRSDVCQRMGNDSPLCELNRALAELDLALENFAAAQQTAEPEYAERQAA